MINFLRVLLCGFALTASLLARIDFGSKDARIVVADGAAFSNNSVTGLAIDQGTLELQDTGAVDGSVINFSSGVLEQDDQEINLTGDYDPSTGAIELSGSSIFTTNAGSSVNDVTVSNADNILQGQGRVDGVITLADADAVLQLGLQSKLGQNIVLSGGMVQLIDDLHFGDDAFFSDDGSVDLNSKKLELGSYYSDVLAPHLFFQNALDISLSGPIELAGMWSFDQDAVINGNGNILDLSSGGAFFVHDASRLTLANVVLKGLGSGAIYFGGDDAELYLSNSTLVLDDDYTFTQGGVYVNAPATVVTGDYTLTFDEQSSLTVDGVTLYYDTLTTEDADNIQPVAIDDPNELHLTLLNNAQIRSTANSSTEPTGDLTITTDTQLSGFSVVSPSRNYIFGADATLDGLSFPLVFAKTSDYIMIIDDAVEARLTDIHLQNASPSSISFGTDSSLILDDLVQFDLAKDDYLENELVVRGACVINGQGRELDLSAGDIIVQGADSSLLIENITLRGIDGYNIRCTDNTQTITFKNVRFILDDTYTMTVGRCEFAGDCVMQGAGTFGYETGIASRVNAGATLTLDGVSLRYEPSAASRDLFGFEDFTARMVLNSATLSSSTAGMRLIRGTLILDHKNYIDSDGSLTTNCIAFGNGTADDDLEIKILPGASINIIAGRLNYANSDA